MGKIGVYGGSFHPIHLGHIRAAEEMAEQLGLDEVLMVPAGSPPHKELGSGAPSAGQRLEMVRLAVQGTDRLRASELEVHRTGPSYTVDTLTRLHAQRPDDELYLLMGTDMFLSLQKWYRADEICRLAQIVCASRNESDSASALQAQAKLLRDHFGARVHVIQNHVLEISSTTVRRMLFFRCAEAYLPEPVLRYIQENGLYGTDRSYRNLSFDELRTVSLSLHKESRVAHVIGCCETARALALRWGADPELAARGGILHDVTKALEKQEQLRLCEKYGILITDFERQHPKLLHAKTAAAVAEHIFGEDPAVVSAIYWHTTGCRDMTLLQKILYIADYSEPNRSFDGVQTIRAYLETDLDLALYTGFSMSLEELAREKKDADQHSYEAWRFLKEERNFS